MKEKDVLLKLRRKFTKDEVVNAIRLELKNTQFELGVLKSEYAELRHENNKLIDTKNKLEIVSLKYFRYIRKGLKIIQYIQDLNKSLSDKNAELSNIISKSNPQQ